MPDFELTVSRLAQALGVSRQSVNELIRERRSVSPEMALRLSRLFGNSAEFWLNAQRAVYLWDTEQSAGPDIQRGLAGQARSPVTRAVRSTHRDGMEEIDI